jgi:hypothetical protein
MKHSCKICKKLENNKGWGWRAGGYMVCVHISKYGNIGNHEGKIPVKSAKNQKKMRDEVGGLMYTRSANIVTLAIRDET